MVDTDTAVLALNQERAKLVHQLKELGATESGDLTGDVDFGEGFADAGAATAERNEVLGIIDNLHDLLEDVDAALVKIQEGSYGTCEDCGEEISPARMEFRPTSRYCVACKTKRRGI